MVDVDMLIYVDMFTKKFYGYIYVYIYNYQDLDGL